MRDLSLLQTPIILDGSGVIVSQRHYSQKISFSALLPLTASSWTRTSARCMGFWPSGHITHTSPWVHATRPDERCINIASYYSESCSSRDSGPLRSVAYIQPSGKSPSSHRSSHSKSLNKFHWSNNWSPGIVWRWNLSAWESAISANCLGTSTNSCGEKGTVKQEKKRLQPLHKILHNNIPSLTMKSWFYLVPNEVIFVLYQLFRASPFRTPTLH